MSRPTDHDLCMTMAAMNLLEPAIMDVLRDQNDAIRARANNALLNIALNRIVDADGHRQAATLLWRVVDVLMTGTSPTDACPVDLSAVH